MKFNVEVNVEFRAGILDPQSQAIGGAIASMGYKSVEKISMGKRFNLVVVEENKDKAVVTVEELCKKLLANPVIENYNYTIDAEGEK